MKRRQALLAMLGTAFVFLAVTGTVAWLAREGSMSWTTAGELVDSLASVSCMATGAVIGIHLSTKPSE